MENNIKINFQNYLNKKVFSSSQKKIKEINFNNFIKNGFPNKRIEDWKFSDLKQIITTNFENIDFSKKEEQSIFEIIPLIKTILLCSKSNVKFSSILDETDSGLDIDALRIVSEGVNSLRNSEKSFLIITHYQRLLDYIKPDFVHVLKNGQIIKSGDYELAKELEKVGYEDFN